MEAPAPDAEEAREENPPPTVAKKSKKRRKARKGKSAFGAFPHQLKPSAFGGRGLFASRAIAAGEVLLAERAYALVVRGAWRSSACSVCLGSARGSGHSVSYGGGADRPCITMAFCSEGCRDAMAGVHRTLGGAFEAVAATASEVGLEEEGVDLCVGTLLLLLRPATLHAAPCSAPASPPSDVEALVSSSPARLAELAASDGMRAVRRALRRAAEALAQTEDILCADVPADLDVSSLEGCDDPDELQEVRAMGSFPLAAYRACLGHVHRINLNAHAVGAEREGLGQQSAFGLFPRLAMVNHSCRPNAHYSAPCAGVSGAAAIGLRAVRGIAAGEEIFISYCDLYQPTRQRRSAMQQEKDFLCSCARCAASDAPAADAAPDEDFGEFLDAPQRAVEGADAVIDGVLLSRRGSCVPFTALLDRAAKGDAAAASAVAMYRRVRTLYLEASGFVGAAHPSAGRDALRAAAAKALGTLEDAKRAAGGVPGLGPLHHLRFQIANAGVAAAGAAGDERAFLAHCRDALKCLTESGAMPPHSIEAAGYAKQLAAMCRRLVQRPGMNRGLARRLRAEGGEAAKIAADAYRVCLGEEHAKAQEAAAALASWGST